MTETYKVPMTSTMGAGVAMAQAPIMPALTISGVLVLRRRELNLTHAQISDHLGIRSPEFIGMVEKGKRRFDLNRIPLLADILQFKRSDLVKIFLAEEAPLAYDALFGTIPALPKDKPIRGMRIRGEAQEVIDILYQLDNASRKEIIDMLHHKRDQRAGKIS